MAALVLFADSTTLARTPSDDALRGRDNQRPETVRGSNVTSSADTAAMERLVDALGRLARAQKLMRKSTIQLFSYWG